MKTTKLIMASLSTVLFSATLSAAETDQFYARSAVIRDSSDEMNGFFHERIGFALNDVNSKKPHLSCRRVAKEVLDHVLGKFSLVEYVKDRDFSKVSVFTYNSPLIERFPEDSVSSKHYHSHSIYKNRAFPSTLVGIARTINLNGIYMGADKMGHFSIVGRTYYKNFLKALEDGKSLGDAQEIAIKKGLKQEVAILGYALGGVLSYGDLEANYQGLLFGRHMCEGENPYLVKEKGRWIHNPIRKFDIRLYVNPKFDEAYNVSFWSPRSWKNMKAEIIRDYCANNADPAYLERLSSYDEIVQHTTNDDLIRNFVKENPRFDRKKQLLGVDCKSL